MAGYVEDRWFKKGPPDPETGKPTRVETARHGQGKRYKVAGIPGVRARSFDRLTGPQGANAWLAKAQHQATAGEFIDPRRGDILLKEYIEQEWWPNKAYEDPATARTVRSRIDTHVLPHLGSLQLNAIKAPQLKRWVAALKGATGPGTINEAWHYLAAILQAAVDDERITKNYCRSQKSVRPPARPTPKPRAWSKERVLAVQEAVDPRFRIAVDIGVGAGLRAGEVFGLAVEDIDEEGERILVRRQIKKVGSKLCFALPKGQKTRTVPVPGYLLKRISEHLAARPARLVTLPWSNPAPGETERERDLRAPRSHALILTGAQGGGMRRDTWDARIWKPALAAAGVIPPPALTKQPIRTKPGVSRTVKTYVESRENGFHALRHTFASVQLDAREPIVAVSSWLGHENASITLRIYAHMMPEADGRGRSAMQAWFEGSL
ncbi:tyrosine-type recombinase/integrase [Streptomyces chartreusis]|uniref:tyrosine-type recombinase/integrase n=1 Tax=Streptomyces chartreusis TaxID=1969 RepID=UPI00369784D0